MWIFARTEFLFKLKVSSKKVVLMGDFNLGGIDWVMLGSGNHEVSCAEELLDIVFSHNLTQIVKGHTRIQGKSEALLDLIFINENLINHAYDCKISPGVSDHSTVHFTLSLKPMLRRIEITSYKNFQKANDESVIDQLSLNYDNFEHLAGNPLIEVNDLWLNFKEMILECTRKFVPVEIRKKNLNSPWITRDIIHHKRRLSRCRARACKKHDGFQQAKIQSLSKELKAKIKTSKTIFFNVKMQNFFRYSPQEFWRQLKPSKKINYQSDSRRRRD